MHMSANVEGEAPMRKPHLTAVPDNPEVPVIRPFERDAYSEGSIATDIGTVVSALKESYQREMGTNNADDYDNKRRSKRLEMATSIFKKFNMIQQEAEVDFAGLYTDAEKRAENPDASRSTRMALLEEVEKYEEHPVMRSVVALARVAGEGVPKHDAVIVQRAAALLLSEVEPPDMWRSYDPTIDRNL